MHRFSVSLRGMAALAAVCASTCFGVPRASAAPLLWAVNANEGTVSTIEGTTGRTVGLPIETGAGPRSIAITPDGQRAYVANAADESVTVVQTGLRIPIATIELSGPAEQVAISADGAKAYVTTGSGDGVAVIDTTTNTVERTIPLGATTSAVATDSIAPFGGSPDEFAYVGVGSEEVQAINPARGTLINVPIDVGGVAKAIAFTPDGKTAYVAAGTEVTAIANGQVVGRIPLGTMASGLTVSPDGSRVYATSAAEETIITIDTATNQILGARMALAVEGGEIALTASGRTAYVATGEGILPVDLIARRRGTAIAKPGAGISSLVVAPDQPPVAAFTSPEATVGVPASFSAAPSTDPDSEIAEYSWGFSDGGASNGMTVTHTYLAPGTYFAMLGLKDDEGCSMVKVFTGRTAYCNGSGIAAVTHPVGVKPPAPACSARFSIGGVSHNRRNGTVRLRLKFPSTGWFLLFSKKIHAVTRKVRRPGTTVVTLHARVELNKRLKKTLRAGVRYRVTFTPSAGCGSKTVHRAVALLRAPRKHHR
jgi:YVTN family beta-propeller protein